MAKSLRARMRSLAYKGIIREKDKGRIISALDVAEEKTNVLDKIRVEITGMYRVILKGTPEDDWAVRWNDCIDEVLQKIDKYRQEG